MIGITSMAMRRRFRAALTQNLGLKLASLVGSIGLFTVVHGAAVGQRSFFVPVYASLPSTASAKILVGELPDKVKLTVIGSQSLLSSIQAPEAVEINLTEAPGYYYLEPELFGLPAGLDVAVVPSALRLEWEDRLQRELPIRAQLRDVPGSQLRVAAGPTITPDLVQVAGPISRVQGLREVVTESVELDQLGPGQHVRNVDLVGLPPNTTVVDNPVVTVELTIEVKHEEHVVKRVLVESMGASSPVRLRPSKVDVVLEGPGQALVNFDPEHIVPIVNLEGVAIGKAPVSVEIGVRGVPPGLSVARVEPPETLVRAR